MLRSLFIITACLLGSSIAEAQIPFQIRVQQGATIVSVGNGGSIALNASNVGANSTLTVLITYRGTTKAQIGVPPQLVGSPDITVVGFPAVAPVLNPGETLTFTVQYHSTSTSGVTAVMDLTYSESLPATAPPTAIPATGLIELTFAGTAPSFLVSYVFQTDANVIPLNPGGTLTFPPIVVNTSSIATLTIANRGSGSGTLDSISVSGDGFQLLGVPLLPLAIGANQQLQVGVRYSPTSVGDSTGTLLMSLGGVQQTYALTASSIVSAFAYEYLEGDSTTPTPPNGTITLPDTTLGMSTKVAVRIRNVTTTSAAVTSINLIGPGFSVTDPPLLPQTLAPNSALVFSMTFTPTQAGTQTGRLQVGNDSFSLSGRGLGPKLEFSYGDTSIVVQPGDAVLFSPVTVTQSSRKPLTVHNTGTLASTITSIGVVDPRSGFSVEGLPSLPLTLQPDQSAMFTIVFAPVTVGFSSTTLRIDSTALSLTGIGNPPPALPRYTISGPSGTVAPFQQPSVGLALADSYPVALTGVLTLNVTSDSFPTDPAVQFVTGGRSLPFTIAANSTQAVFPNGLSQVRLQTGTVAATLTLTPSFATQVGGIDLTPQSPAVLQMQVLPSAPQLIAVSLNSLSSNGFVLAITGFSTARSLSNVQLSFTAAPPYQLPNLKATLDVSQQATTWFTNPVSSSYGGQFTILLPLNVTTSPPSATVPVPTNILQTVTVAVANQQGLSNTVTLQLH
jgi:hypothetical protein